MKKYYQIQYWNWLSKIWVFYNFKKYSSLKNVKKEIKSYQDHKLGVKLRILKVQIYNES